MPCSKIKSITKSFHFSRFFLFLFKDVPELRPEWEICHYAIAHASIGNGLMALA